MKCPKIYNFFFPISFPISHIPTFPWHGMGLLRVNCKYEAIASSCNSPPLGISPVEDMDRWVNLRHLINGEETRATDISTPLNLTDWETKDSNISFLHGFNVTKDEARGWNAEIIKRLWQSESDEWYWAVTLYQDIGTGTLLSPLLVALVTP